MLFLFCHAFVFASEVHANQVQLTVDQYLSQVRLQNPQLKATTALIEAYELNANEADLLLSPAIFGNVQHTMDKKEQSSAALMGQSTAVESAQIGISKQTTFGLQSKASYTLNRYRISGANSALMPEPSFFEAKPTIEVSQSLLKNQWGSETKATKSLIESRAKAQALSEKFKERLILADAENAYWRLALARESVFVTQQSLERARRIHEWAQRRSQLNLADRADALQAEAGMRARNLELQLAIDEEKAASRIFNSIRGMDQENVAESLSPLKEVSEKAIAILQPKGRRLDVLAAIEAESVARANQQLSKEKYRPQLDLFGSISLNGRDPQITPATSESVSTKFPTYAVGLKFNALLGGDALEKQRLGLAKEVLASELTTAKRRFDEDREIKNINALLEEAKRRLILVQEIEAIQQDKYQNERTRQSAGRSTLFQVLQFEQDLASAQLNRARAQAELLKIASQMKTFGE